MCVYLMNRIRLPQANFLPLLLILSPTFRSQRFLIIFCMMFVNQSLRTYILHEKLCTMKKTILLFALLITLGAVKSFAQIRKVPAEVTDAFKAKYPDAKNVEWKDKVTSFQADFKLNDAEMTTDFSPKGEWQETAKKMDYDALPGAVKD